MEGEMPRCHVFEVPELFAIRMVLERTEKKFFCKPSLCYFPIFVSDFTEAISYLITVVCSDRGHRINAAIFPAVCPYPGGNLPCETSSRIICFVAIPEASALCIQQISYLITVVSSDRGHRINAAINFPRYVPIQVVIKLGSMAS
ncbi:hypothetical protein CEXT_646811 [Caerostris extrusa]|uniref:Uncharacterized protein n=1 Tax=Caerostris extrusa TaxID=172846 RepID=A0AAV4UHP3_CAEEX|nr:hypothetical protein CEXT_646811 [Caerostris extrusa]